MLSTKSAARHRSKIAKYHTQKRRIAQACAEGLEGRLLFSNIGAGPLAIPQVVADLNGDGHADIVSFPGDSSLVADVSFGNGDDSFQPPLALVLPAGANKVLVADVNSDGRPDLMMLEPTGAAASFTQALTVLINNGDGTFQSGVFTNFGVGNGLVFSGDFNGDGKADLLIESGISNSAAVTLGNGDGTFGALVPMPAGPIGAFAGIADFNGDGHQDVAMALGRIDNPDGSMTFPVAVYQGNGNGTFQQPTTSNNFTPSASSPAVTAALGVLFQDDFNGDGIPDLLTTINHDTTLTIGPTRQDPGLHIVTRTHTPTTLTVQLLNAAGVPQPGVTYDIGNSAGVQQVLDLNGDGHLDMVIENTVGDRVFINNGEGAFRDSGFHGSNGPVAVGDFNEDGLQDLVTTGGDIFLGNSDGSFNAPVSANVLGEGATATAVGDLNGDGNPDTVVTNTLDNNVSIAFGNGHGQFWSGGTLSAGTAGLSGQGPRGVAIGDFTGDGIPDIAIAEEGAPDDIGILAGNGDGTFQPVTFHGLAGGTAFEMVSADFNGDGIADLLVTNPFTRTAEVIAGGSLNVVDILSANLLAKLAVGDFNGDGRPDFVIDSTIYLNGGSFDFTPHAINSGLTGDSSIAVADFNGDGHWDLAYSDQQLSLDVTSSLMVLLGNGDGTFQAPYSGAPGQQKTLSQGFVPSISTPGTSLAAGDFNGDGIPDLAVNGIFDIGVSFGRGDGGFYPQTFFNSTGGLSAALTAADVNHDGRSDILQIDTGTSDTRYIAGGSLDVFLNAVGDRQPQFGAAGFKVSAPPTVTENDPFNVTVTAVDAQGNAVPGFLGTVYLSLDRQISIPYTFTAADAGTLTITNSELALTQGAHTVTAAAPFMSAGRALVDAEPGRFSLSIPATAAAGDGLPITITALDALGNLMPTFSGTITISSSDPRVTPISPFFNLANAGVFTIPATQFGAAVYFLKTAGNQTISTTSAYMGVTTEPITITPGAPTSFVISNPGPVTAGVPFTFTVTAFDRFGNFAPAYTPAVSFSDTLLNTGVFTPDPGATLPAAYTYTTADAGVRQFTATLSVAGATALLVNSSQGVLDLNVMAAPNNQLRLSNTPATIAAGQPFGFVFQALDQFGNIAGGFGDTLHFSSTDPQAIVPANLTGQNNLTLLATLKTSGNQSITVTDLSNPAIAPKTVTIPVTAAAASSLLVAMPASTTDGVVQSVTVIAREPFGNIVTNYAGTVHFSSSDTRNKVPADYTFTAADAGTHTFSVTMAAAGSQSLSVQDTAGPANGVAFIAVSPSTAASFTVSGFPATTAGVVHNFTVVALDAFSNIATGYTGTVTFGSSDVQAGLPASYTFIPGDGGSHTFAATLKTAGMQSISVADASSSTIRGTQSGIAVTHSTATHFAIVAPSTAGTGKSFLITVSALDAFGNVDTGYLGKVHLGATVSTSLSSNYSFTAGDAGTHTFSVTLNTAGVQTISVSDTLNSSILGSVTLTVSTPVSGGGTGGGGTGGGGTGGGGTGGGGRTA
jgi:hypothetical protein